MNIVLIKKANNIAQLIQSICNEKTTIQAQCPQRSFIIAHQSMIEKSYFKRS